MVEITTIVGFVGMFATALMILGMLYLTFLGARSDRHDVDPESPIEEE